MKIDLLAIYLEATSIQQYVFKRSTFSHSGCNSNCHIHMFVGGEQKKIVSICVGRETVHNITSVISKLIFILRLERNIAQDRS